MDRMIYKGSLLELEFFKITIEEKKSGFSRPRANASLVGTMPWGYLNGRLLYLNLTYALFLKSSLP